jgi:hypothetical protein
MNANKLNKLARNILLTIALIVIALFNVGCDDNANALDSEPDKGVATWFWQCVVQENGQCEWK